MSKKPQNKRAPMAFDVESEEAKPAKSQAKNASAQARTKAEKPRASGTKKQSNPRKAQAISVAKVVESDRDYFDISEEEAEIAATPPPKKSSWIGKLFFASIGVLLTTAFALWTDQLIRNLFTRADWLGWVALAAAALALLAFLIFIYREIASIWRQASIAKLQKDLRAAHDLNNNQEAKKAVLALRKHTKKLTGSAKGQQSLDDIDDTIMDGRDRILFAEKELLSTLDTHAIALVKGSAKRVSVVTAVSPRAIIDVSYVVIENMRLIRRLSLHYGGKPGTVGMFRLARSVIGHLAVTGSIAVGETLIQQLVGQGLAARISARLGEGMVNGLMTIRVGIAAIEVTRPAPFLANTKPKVSDFTNVFTSEITEPTEPAK